MDHRAADTCWRSTVSTYIYMYIYIYIYLCSQLPTRDCVRKEIEFNGEWGSRVRPDWRVSERKRERERFIGVNAHVEKQNENVATHNCESTRAVCNRLDNTL